MTTRMRPEYARDLRAALVDHVDGDHRTARPLRRGAAALALGLGAVLAGAGLAAAAGVFIEPGSDVARPLATAVTVDGTGTSTVETAAAPTGTNAVELALTCLTPGSFTGPDGSRLDCGPTDAQSTATWRAPAVPGQTGVPVRAERGARWRVTVTYSTVTTTAWGINANGQSYGVQNSTGTPDLISVVATNGRHGYAFSRDLEGPRPKGLQRPAPTPPAPRAVPVYEADGKTKIGSFRTG